MRRVLFSPKWLALHLLLIICVLLFARLGWWQWEKGRSSHGTLQNLFYGIEWPVFAGFAIFMWWKMLRDELSPPKADEAGGPSGESAADDGGADRADRPVRRAAVSTLPMYAEEDEEDEELAAYNRYLSSLYERDEQRL